MTSWNLSIIGSGKHYKRPQLLLSWYEISLWKPSCVLASVPPVLDHAHVSSPISTELIPQSRSCQSWSTGDAAWGGAALERKDRNSSGPGEKIIPISECKDGIIQKQPEELRLLSGSGVKKRLRTGEMSRNGTSEVLFSIVVKRVFKSFLTTADYCKYKAVI